MIRYTLICEKRHEFESWFRDSHAFDVQAARGQVVCPQCGSRQVTKALMAPGIASRGADPRPGNSDEDTASLVRRVREYVEKNADYVGDRFPEEARKIHREESEPRGIYGEATDQETKELREEGIEVQPLPVLPEERN